MEKNVEFGSSRKKGGHPQVNILSNKWRRQRLAQIVILHPLGCSVIMRKQGSVKFAPSAQFESRTFQSQDHLVGSATRFLGTHLNIIWTVGKKVVALFRVDNTL